MFRRRRLSLRFRFKKEKIILYGLIGLVGVIILGFIASFAAFAWFSRALPSPDKLSQGSQSSTVFYDRNGKVIYEQYKDTNRVPVPHTDISDWLKKATVSIEDKNFYKHKGISEGGILRAFLKIVTGQGIQGGSTITQQLIKNVLLSSEQTIPRKIKEAILAQEVEKRYTKDEILGMYLNEAPYGGTIAGVGAAAKTYYGKDPKDLTLLESAILAGLPQSPTYYSPYIGTKDTWKGRTKDVLRRMREDGYITKEVEAKTVAQVEKYKFAAPRLSINAPHYVFYIEEQLKKEFGENILSQGLKIKTTLDLDIQQKAEKIVHDEIESLKSIQVGNGAALVLDSQTGDILAYVGSYDYNDDKYGKFDVISQGKRQPGSSIKPIMYALALEKGYTPATVLMDVKTNFTTGNTTDKDYTPVNYDGKFHGPVQLRFALGNSFNIPAVKMLAMVGIKDFLQTAYDFGIKDFQPTQQNLDRFGLAITLGGGESNLMDMTGAFSVFARGGTRREIQSIQEITDYKGKTIYKKPKASEKRVISQEVAFLISHILSDNNARSEEFGSNSELVVPGKTVSVKTGTTDDKRDNYTIGFTKSITVGVWVGNNDYSPMNQKVASGITGASPIWHDIMVEILKNKKYTDGIMDKPDKVKAIEIDQFLGGLPKDGQPKRSEYFAEGTEPTALSPYYKKLKISKATGKLANDVEVRQGNYDEKEYIVITENDPVSTDGRNRWQEAIDEWAKSQPDDRLKPPTEKSDANAEDIAISINSPGDKSTVNAGDGSVNIKAKLASGVSFKNVKVFINGSEKFNYDGNKTDIDETVKLVDGTYELKVQARNDKDKVGESVIHFGVNQPWDITPTPTPH